MAHQHHSSLAANRDYLAQADKGDLADPRQSAGFTVDPLLAPISATGRPHAVLPDPTPSSDPELFDQSTRHPNSHYDHDKTLSKKKRNKKLGLGGPVGPSATGGVHAGGRNFSEHEKLEHERAERREENLGHEHDDAHDDDDDEDEDEDEGDDGSNSRQEAAQSHQQHAENRVTATEASGQSAPLTKPMPKPSGGDQDKEGGASSSGQQKPKDGEKGEKGEKGEGDKGEGEEQEANPSLMQRAGGLLSTAQERATGVLASASGTVGGLLSKVGLTGQKDAAKDAGKDAASPADENAQAKKEETEA